MTRSWGGALKKKKLAWTKKTCNYETSFCMFNGVLFWGMWGLYHGNIQIFEQLAFSWMMLHTYIESDFEYVKFGVWMRSFPNHGLPLNFFRTCPTTETIGWNDFKCQAESSWYINKINKISYLQFVFLLLRETRTRFGPTPGSTHFWCSQIC